MTRQTPQTPSNGQGPAEPEAALAPQPSAILWGQTLGLSAIQTALSLSWLMYRLYLPALLATAGLAGTERVVTVVEDALAGVIEPVVGRLSDRARYRVGSRFPLVGAAVVGVAAFSLALPVLALAGVAAALKWGFLVFVLGWAVVMAAVRSPAIALIGQYARATSLPQATSLLVLVGTVIGLVGGLIKGNLLALGPLACFGLATASLLGAATLLRALGPDRVLTAAAVPPPSEPLPPRSRSSTVRRAIVLYVLGWAMAWGLRLLLGTVSGALPARFDPLSPAVALLAFNLAVGLLALPLGAAATVWGNERAVAGGSLVLAGALPLLAAFPSGPSAGPLLLAATIAAAIAWTIVFNGGIPIAFTLLPERAGWAIGLYFGGFSLGMASFGLIFSLPPSLVASGGLAAGVFLAVGAIAWFSLPAPLAQTPEAEQEPEG